MSEWKNELVKHAHKVNFPIHTPYYELTEAGKEYPMDRMSVTLEEFTISSIIWNPKNTKFKTG